MNESLSIILPAKNEALVVEQHSYIQDWGGWFVTAVPNLRVRA